MLAVQTARWVLGTLLRQPAVWLWTALMLALWPAVLALAPGGQVSGLLLDAAPIYEIAFLALLSGVVAGANAIQGESAQGDTRRRGQGRFDSWFLRPLSVPRRLVVESVALSVGAALFLVPALLPALLLPGAAPDVRWAPLLLGSLQTHAHLSAIALLLLRTPAAPAQRALALPVLTWVLPALAPPSSAAAPYLRHLLAAGGVLSQAGQAPASVPSGAAWLAGWGPIIGLGLIAWLVSGPAAATHALRNPR